MGRRGGRASQRMTELVLETYGRVCWLQLPGCTGLATTKDHVIPHAHGGPDTLENFRPACKPCNSKRQDRVMTGYGADALVARTADYQPRTSLPRHAAQPRGLDQLMTTVLGNVGLCVAVGVLIGLALAIGLAVLAGGIQ